MNITLRFRLGIVLALAAALAGCEGPCTSIDRINGPALSSNGVDLSTYVAVGTSLSSGYMSGGLVDRHQVQSFPALFATQIGKTSLINGQGTFTFPAINGDGIPPLLEIRSYNPPALSNSGRVLGSPTNIAQPSAYHNLGIPGAVLLDLVDSTHYHATVPPVNRTNFTYWDIIQRRRGVLLQQALSLQPTIMSLEYGANELLGPTVNAGTSPNPATNLGHAALMTAALNAIHTASPGTRVAVVNVPDVTSIPFFTTIPPFVEIPGVGTVFLAGADSVLTANDLVLLSAATLLGQGYGVPGNPLPESVILRAPEVAATQIEVNEMNAVVDSVAQRPFVTKVDLHGLLQRIAVEGYPIGADVYTSDFIRGGLFGLDGIHPNDLGYALLANELIAAVNSKFGCVIPSVNPSLYATPDASRARPATDRWYPIGIENLQQGLDMLFPYRR
jgi:hypothetical protein